MEAIRVIIDALLFTFFGISLGFLVDMIFPEPNYKDSTFSLIAWTFIQIVLTIYIAYVVDGSYVELFNSDSDTYLGFTAFTVIFFLVQVQLLNRLNILYHRLTGKNL